MTTELNKSPPVHTPGQWRYDQSATGTFNIWTDYEMHSMADETLIAHGIDNEDDALLLAAAPAMLAELETIWTKVSTHQTISFDDCNRILSLIHKARGQQ